MYVSVVFIVLFTCLSICTATTDTEREIIKKINRIKSLDDIRRMFQVKDPYKQNKRSLPERTVAEVPCKPHPTVLELPMQPGQILIPHCISVQRCGGCCTAANTMECVANRTSTHTFDAFKVMLDGTVSYTNVTYTDHDTCKCQCRVKKHHCINQQTYDPSNCLCICNIQAPQCNANKQWSRTDCDCVCKLDGNHCPTNHIWNKESCQCECSLTQCPPNKQLDKQSCTCI